MRARVPGSLTPWFPALIATPTLAVGGKERRPSWLALTRSVLNLPSLNRLQVWLTKASRWSHRRRIDDHERHVRDDLISRGRPPGRPQLLVSGDVNQGGEMKVLP